jgi:MarR family transcriptional regulator, lower aerobic nicotinate degradation pathway regulator
MPWQAAGRAGLTSNAQDADSPEYLLEDQVGHLLRRAHQRHTAIFQATIGDNQLTPLQFAALMKLADVGETSQNQLGRLTAMDAATMQGVIKRLIARGFIERRPDPDDRRRLLLTLTKEGGDLVAAATARGHRITDDTLDPLSPAERQTFLRLLRRLSD